MLSSDPGQDMLKLCLRLRSWEMTSMTGVVQKSPLFFHTWGLSAERHLNIVAIMHNSLCWTMAFWSTWRWQSPHMPPLGDQFMLFQCHQTKSFDQWWPQHAKLLYIWTAKNEFAWLQAKDDSIKICHTFHAIIVYSVMFHHWPHQAPSWHHKSDDKT